MAAVSAYFSYAQQAGHYFDRPHRAPLRAPLESPAAWLGPELAGRDDWRFVLTPGHVEEIEAALAHAEATGRPTGALVATDFPLPTLAGAVTRWREEIRDGRGFQVVSGLPVGRWTREQAERVFWCLGLHMGRPGAQNVHGDLLGHVTDTGEDAADPFVRLYRTSADIAYHCDAADVVGLLCLQRARKGGASRIVSSVSVFNRLVAERPEAVDRLFEPFLLDVRNEDAKGAVRFIPVPPCRHADGRLRTFYHSDYFRSVQRFDDVPEFTPAERALLDRYEEIASSPELYLDMDLEPGDVQWLSNHVVLHARTAYEDDPDPARKRHLLRLWLSLDA
jgi:hypothetical protein